MTDYTTLSNTAVGVGGLPSGATVTALRDNPLAIAEGTSGAPKVQSAALNMAVITSAGVLTGLERVATMLCMASAQQAGEGTANVQYRLSTDGGSTWTGYTTVVSVTVPGGSSADSTQVASAQITVGPTYNAIEFAVSGNGDFFAIGIKGVSP